MSTLIDKISKKERAELLEAEKYGRVAALTNELISLFCNSVRYTGIPDDIPPEYITIGMLMDGSMVVKKDDPDTWYRAKPAGALNRYGLPNSYNLGFANGIIVENNVPYEDVHVIKANAKRFPWFIKFVQSAQRIENLERSAEINVAVSRNTDIVPVPTDKDAQSIERFYKSARDGAVAVAVTEQVAEMLRGKIENKTEFTADKIMTLARAEWEDIIKRCGIVSANNFKRERVQTAEVNAGAGESIDYIYMYIDTFNADCERAGLPARAQFNGYAQAFDELDDDEQSVTAAEGGDLDE